MTNLRDEVRGKVGIAVGHGSLCWEPRPIGVFDSTEASKAVDTATTEIFQAIVREVMPHLDGLERVSHHTIEEELWRISDIKKLLGVEV